MLKTKDISLCFLFHSSYSTYSNQPILLKHLLLIKCSSSLSFKEIQDGWMDGWMGGTFSWSWCSSWSLVLHDTKDCNQQCPFWILSWTGELIHIRVEGEKLINLLLNMYLITFSDWYRNEKLVIHNNYVWYVGVFFQSTLQFKK